MSGPRLSRSGLGVALAASAVAGCWDFERLGRLSDGGAVAPACAVDGGAPDLACAGACAWVTGPPSWRAVPDLPTPRTQLAAATDAAGRIVLMGGGPNGEPSRDVTIFDPASGAWSPGPSMTTARAAFGAAAVGAKIYAVGGEGGGGGTDSVEVLDTGAASPSWRAGPRLASARRHHAVVGVPGAGGGTLLALQGIGLDGALLGSERLEVGEVDPSWRPTAAAPGEGAYMPAALGSDGRVYLIDTTSSTYAYDPRTDSWSEAPALPTPRDRGAAVLAPDGRLYAIAGEASNGLVDAYVPGQGWAKVARLPRPSAHLAAAVGGDGRIYAFGGSGGTHHAYGPIVRLSASGMMGENFGASATVWVLKGALVLGRGETDSSGDFRAPISLRCGGLGRVTVVDDESRYPVSVDVP